MIDQQTALGVLKHYLISHVLDERMNEALVQGIEALQENAALREIAQWVAACETRESEGWQQVGLFHDTVNVLWIRDKARALLGKSAEEVK